MSLCLQGEGGGGHMREESVEEEKHNRGMAQLCNKPTVRHNLSTELQSTSVNMTALWPVEQGADGDVD